MIAVLGGVGTEHGAVLADHQQVLAAIRTAVAGEPRARDSAAFQDVLHTVAFEQVGGGLSNYVYRYHLGSEAFVAKLYPRNDPPRPYREWTALELLRRRVPGVAPCPILRDADDVLPAVVMTWLPGAPLGDQPFTAAQLAALQRRLQEVWGVTPEEDGPHLLPAAGGASTILARLREHEQLLFHHRAQLPVPARDLWALGAAWLDGPDPDVLSQPTVRVFSRGDLNPRNLLWDGRQLRMVDFEHSGWSDRATDLADVVEHVQARHTADATWLGFVDSFRLTPAERRRFQAGRRLFALFWAFLLWRLESTGRTGSLPFAEQLTRAISLLTTSTAARSDA